MNNKIKKYILEELEKSEKYIYKVFIYLKELESINQKDLRLQKEIWNLCEAGELISTSAIELEYLED